MDHETWLEVQELELCRTPSPRKQADPREHVPSDRRTRKHPSLSFQLTLPTIPETTVF